MSKQLVRFYSIFLILTLLLAQFGVRPAAADTIFTVNSTADKVDANPGDGSCQTDTTDECTLRAAIQEANALPGADTILIDLEGIYTLTMEGTGEDLAATGDLDITENLIITGAGMTKTIIDANGLDRAFHQLGGSLTLSDLTIQNGLANPGGGLLVDGVSRLENYGQATVSRVAFADNRATSDASDGTGGGIYVTDWGSATISQSTFTSNEGFYGGGAVASSSNGAVFSITDSTFDSNTSHCGGGALYPNGGIHSVWNS